MTNSGVMRENVENILRILNSAVAKDAVEFISVSGEMENDLEDVTKPNDTARRYAETGNRYVELRVKWYDPETDKVAKPGGDRHVIRCPECDTRWWPDATPVHVAGCSEAPPA